MEDIIKDLKAHIGERVSSPLLGSFIISWCIWNYKFLIIILSSASVTATFRLISEVSFPDYLHVIGFGVIAPLCTALAYIYIYPIPAKKVYEYSLKRQTETAQIKQRIENETPLTVEKSLEIRQNMSRQMKEHYEEIEIKEAEISKLKATIAELTAQIQKSEEKKPKKQSAGQKSPPTPLTETELDTLESAAREGGFITKYSLSQLSSDERLRLEFQLGELAKKGLVEAVTNGYKLTHEGRGALIRERPTPA